MATPDPSNVAPWYLRNINQALALDDTSGNVYLRTGMTGNIIISGNVNIPGNVDAHISEIGTSGNLTVPWMPVSIDGNANVKVTSGNITVAQGTSPWVVSGNVTASLTSNSQVQITGQNLDAFARLRVSNPYTFFDSALTGERRYDWSSATSTGGTVTFDYNANVRNLNVTTASGSEVVRESMWCFPYQAGKSLLTMSSFCMNAAKTGLRQRVGYFTSNNGIYFEQANTTKNMVIRSSSSGSLVEERVPQANWNTDKLDGTGPSGITLDTSATQIFWCDVEWLGVGTVRTGFVINGQFIVCHTFNHANNPTYTTTYMGTATLPCRYEITNTAGTVGTSTMKQICSTVISEGGYNMPAATQVVGTGTNTVRLSTAGTYYPIASIRLNSSYLNSIVKVSQVDILSTSVNYYRWVLIKNGTLTGATWAAPGSTRVDADIAATAITGGTIEQSGFATARIMSELNADNIYSQLGRTVSGVSDIYTLAIAATANNADVLAQLGWQEIV